MEFCDGWEVKRNRSGADWGTEDSRATAQEDAKKYIAQIAEQAMFVFRGYPHCNQTFAMLYVGDVYWLFRCSRKVNHNQSPTQAEDSTKDDLDAKWKDSLQHDLKNISNRPMLEPIPGHQAEHMFQYSHTSRRWYSHCEATQKYLQAVGIPIRASMQLEYTICKASGREMDTVSINPLFLSLIVTQPRRLSGRWCMISPTGRSLLHT